MNHLAFHHGHKHFHFVDIPARDRLRPGQFGNVLLSISPERLNVGYRSKLPKTTDGAWLEQLHLSQMRRKGKLDSRIPNRLDGIESGIGGSITDHMIVKLEAGLGPNQLGRYREVLEESRSPQTTLVCRPSANVASAGELKRPALRLPET